MDLLKWSAKVKSTPVKSEEDKYHPPPLRIGVEASQKRKTTFALLLGSLEEYRHLSELSLTVLLKRPTSAFRDSAW